MAGFFCIDAWRRVPRMAERPGTATVSALLLVRCVSSVVLWMDFTLEFAILAFSRGASTLVVGLAAMIYALPGLMLGPWIGALTDRLPAAPVLSGCYLLRAGTSIAIISCDSLGVMLGLIVLHGFSNLGAMPAEQILVKKLLPEHHMVMNLRVVTIVDQAAKIGAPAFGGWVAQRFGSATGFWLSASLVVPALICLEFLRSEGARSDRLHQGASRAPTERGQIWHLLRADETYRLAFAAAWIQTAVLGLYDPLLVLFLKGLGCGAAVFGQIVSATALGGVAGAMAFRNATSRAGWRLVLYALIGFGLSVLVPGVLAGAGVRLPTALLLGLWVINGLCYGITAMHFGVTQQAHCPAQCIGAVTATARSAQLTALAAGPMLGAMLATHLGIASVLVLAGAVSVAFGVVASLRWRRPA